MGKKAPKTPPAPDPVATAQAQGAINKEAAIANAELGMVNQYTPYGNLTFTQRGTSAAGTPQYDSRVELSPEQQQLLNLSNQGDIGTAQLGVAQLGRITDAVSSPFSFVGLPSYGEADQTAAAARAEEALMSRMNPQFQRDEEALRTRLINQGIGQGSQAYSREMEQFNQAKNDARMQAVLSGQQYGSRDLADALTRRNQGIQEYTTQRNAPLNEYSALVSGSQIQNPQFQATGSGNMQPVDYTGLVQNNYSNQVNAANARAAARNSGLSQAGSLLGNAASAYYLFSDVRLKENILPVGEENGHNIYEFNYKGDSSRYSGVMAQEVAQTNPDAVIEIDGFLAVNYNAIGVQMREVV